MKMNKRGAVISSVILLLVIAAAAWAYFRTDPVVAEMQMLQDQLFANRDLPEAERRAHWDNFRQRMDGLTDAQRSDLRSAGRDRWEQFAQQRMDQFFQLSPADQRKQLDEMIDRMENRDRTPNPNAGRGGRGGGGRNLSDAQRAQRGKERLDRTSPKMRAQFTEFRRLLNDRRAERGLPPSEGRPGGGRWRG